MVVETDTLNNLATTYKNYGSWVGLTSGASAGTSSTPASEATGGSYARQATTWGTVAGGVVAGGAVTIPVAAATYTYVLLASASSGNNQYDTNTITNVTMGATGSIVVTPTFTQT
jgi:hypothetical protein